MTEQQEILWSVMVAARNREHAEAIAVDIHRSLQRRLGYAPQVAIMKALPDEMVGCRAGAELDVMMLRRINRRLRLLLGGLCALGIVVLLIGFFLWR
jgi:hypothetical protein